MKPRRTLSKNESAKIATLIVRSQAPDLLRAGARVYCKKQGVDGTVDGRMVKRGSFERDVLVSAYKVVVDLPKHKDEHRCTERENQV
jgi:hypothetical protein